MAWAPRPSPPGDTLFCVRSLPKPGAVFRLWGAVLQAGRCSPGFALLGSSYERGLLSVNVSLNAPPVEWKWCTVIFPPHLPPPSPRWPALHPGTAWMCVCMQKHDVTANCSWFLCCSVKVYIVYKLPLSALLLLYFLHEYALYFLFSLSSVFHTRVSGC